MLFKLGLMLTDFGPVRHCLRMAAWQVHELGLGHGATLPSMEEPQDYFWDVLNKDT